MTMKTCTLCIAAAATCLVGALAAPGQGDAPRALTFDDAVALARANSPALRALESREQAQSALALQAGFPANPSLETEAENVAGSGAFSGVDAAEYTVLLTQPLQLGGKRTKRRRVAELDGRLAAWDRAAAERTLIRDVATAFTDALADREMLDIAVEVARIAGELVETAARRVASGAASALEQTKAEIERATAEAEHAEGRARLKASRRRLAALLALPEPELPPVSGELERLDPLPSFEAVRERAASSPELARWADEAEQREAAADLADAEAVPDLEVGVGFRRDEGAAANAFLLSAGLPLPLFDRNQGVREASRLAQSAAEDERRAAAMALERELAAAYGELSQAHARAAAMRDEVLPAAQKAFDLSRDGYLQGRFGYLELLDAQRTLFETRAGYVEALRAAHHAAAEIERLAPRGRPTPSTPKEQTP